MLVAQARRQFNFFLTLPDPLPPRWNLNVYCQFHQNGGHTTCRNLKKKMKDLIDEGKIAIEEEAAPAAGNAANPNERMGVFKDPLPNHPLLHAT